MIIGMSLTHNDKTKGWLQNWLETNSKHFDKWVIYDDCSTDDTFNDIIAYTDKALKEHNCEIIHVKATEPLFVKDEILLRTRLWNRVRNNANKGDWIINIDSDELINDEFSRIKTYTDLGPFMLVFKKEEMWNETEFRVDGLWSNYFERMFPFIDMEFGYNGKKGFHYPCSPEYTKDLKRFNTNIAIKHLAYSTPELRDAKYKFMMSNPQQKKDLNWYHFQTIKLEPKLERGDVPRELGPTLINISFVNLYKIPELTRNFIKNSLKNTDINFTLIASNCNKNVYDDIVEFSKSDKVKKMFVSKLNPENDRQLRLTQTKQLVMENVDLLKYNHIFFLDGEQEFGDAVFNRIIGLDKDLFLNYPFNTLLYMTYNAYISFPKEIKDQLYSNLNYAELLMQKYICWNYIMEMPQPLQQGISPRLLGLEMKKDEDK